MVTFRNNNNNSKIRRSSFRRNTRNFKSNSETSKYGSNYSNNENFKRKSPGRNNHNAPKLIEKYNDLAREALSNGDKILSENYLQHADHFTRVLNEKENLRKERFLENKETPDAKHDEDNSISNNNILEDTTNNSETDKTTKPQVEVI